MKELTWKVFSDIEKEYNTRISEGQDPEEADFFNSVSFAKKYGYSEDILINSLEELNANDYILMDITGNFWKK